MRVQPLAVLEELELSLEAALPRVRAEVGRRRLDAARQEAVAAATAMLRASALADRPPAGFGASTPLATSRGATTAFAARDRTPASRSLAPEPAAAASSTGPRTTAIRLQGASTALDRWCAGQNTPAGPGGGERLFQPGAAAARASPSTTATIPRPGVAGIDRAYTPTRHTPAGLSPSPTRHAGSTAAGRAGARPPFAPHLPDLADLGGSSLTAGALSPTVPGSSSGAASTAANLGDGMCPVCFSRPRATVVNCGHLFCAACAARLQRCAICRTPVNTRTHVFL